MDAKELETVRRNLDRFLKPFADGIKTAPSRAHLTTYVSGQISGLERKSVEPMALAADIPPRTLQEFLGLHRWDEVLLREHVQAHVACEHPYPNAIAIVDETGCPKKGNETVGVERQYCGATGKIDNCVMTVQLGYATPDFQTLIDSDLYLPKKWMESPERRRKVGIPETVEFREKWRIGLDLLDRAKGQGVTVRWVTADEEYGKAAGFRHGVATRGLLYVVEVPKSTYGWLVASGRRARIVVPRTGPRRADEMWADDGPAWQAYHVKNTELGAIVWEARAGRVVVSEEHRPGEEQWLLVARNVLDGEVKYFLSNAPGNTRVEAMLAVGFSRCRIERMFEDTKGEIGFDHFEVRGYRAVLRHMIISLVSHLFLMEETDRLRKKKSVVECVPGAAGGGGATGPGSAEIRTAAAAGAPGGRHRVRAGAA